MSLKPLFFARTRSSAISAVLVASLAAPLLGGCFVGAVAGITAGSLAAADRRTVGTQVEDRSLQLKAESAIRESFGENVHVNATVYNRQVLLTGEAPDDNVRAQVEARVLTLPNIRLVVNDIQIGFKSSLSARSNDAFITGKVKACCWMHKTFSPIPSRSRPKRAWFTSWAWSPNVKPTALHRLLLVFPAWSKW